MSVAIGDTVFDAIGRPGVVIGRDDKKQLIVEREGENFEKTRARGFINGIENQPREDYNQIIKDVRELKSPRERLQVLGEKVEDLQKDPRNYLLVRYLEAEMTHIMNSENIQPRTFRVDESSVR